MFRIGIHRVLWVLTTCAAIQVSAQGCYYPDGLTLSNDQPCRLNGQQTSCCAAGAYCLGNGLCFDNGLLLRASCTDKTWSSPNCATVCVAQNKSEAVIVNPCSDSGGTTLFTCGLGDSTCKQPNSTFSITQGYELVLQPSLQAQLAQSLHLASALPSSGMLFTTGQLAGATIGVALPLLVALGITIFFLVRERQQRTRRESHTRLTSEGKGYESLPAGVQSINHPSRTNSTPSTPGLPHSPGHHSPLASPALNQGTQHSIILHPPAPASPVSYHNGTIPSHRGPTSIDAVATGERPHSSGTSQQHSAFPTSASSTIRREASSSTMLTQVPRLQPIHTTGPHDSIRTQAIPAGNMPSPPPAHMSSFAQRYEVMQQRAAIQTASAQQQLGLSNRSPVDSGPGTHEMDTRHAPSQLVTTEYSQNISHHYAQMMTDYSPVQGRVELDSDESNMVRHELGDGRRSWGKT